MYDMSELIGKTLIQHGKYNDRIYLMQMSDDDKDYIIDELERIAEEKKYSKIIAKVKSEYKNIFLQNSYTIEAYVPRFYEGEIACLFMSNYLNKRRGIIKDEIKEKIENNLELAQSKIGKIDGYNLDPKFKIGKITKEEIWQLAGLYKKVFATYPFPIYEESFLLKTMDTIVDYYGVFLKEKLIAASSAEKCHVHLNSEMTDFATDPEYLGNSFALKLLLTMEEDMKKSGYKMLYTIARSMSVGMNITFAKMEYKFAGTLINNTNISGNIECMNVWYKII